jgi:hypothetical protein
MITRRILLMLMLCAACRAAPQAVSAIPTPPPFPTMTPGYAIVAALPPPPTESIANPATAIALANPPTATPNYRACPAPDSSVRLPAGTPSSARLIENAIAAFLNAGGTLVNLERGLRETWAVLGDTGVVRGDIDMTGEGIPEVIVALLTPDAGGMLMIFGCVDSRYQPLYRGAPDETLTFNVPPQILRADDLNRSGLRKVVFTARRCASSDEASCLYYTQMAAWDRQRGRISNLLAETVVSASPPTLSDIDNDGVLELIVRMDNPGNAQTGPLRTGYTAYDWNGLVYTASITQLDPPRFRIQVIHSADAAFKAGNLSEAVALYDLSLNSPSLEPWRGGDENRILQSYALYRLMLAFAYTNDARLVPTVQAVFTTYPDMASAPIYARLAADFWSRYQLSGDLSLACAGVREIVNAQPEALGLLNRYGSRSPTYTASDLCPF